MPSLPGAGNSAGFRFPGKTVAAGRHAEAGLKYLIEIAEVVVSHIQTDIRHGQGRVLEQIGCLVQPLFLEQVLVIFSCMALDDTAEPVEVIAQFLCKLRQFPIL